MTVADEKDREIARLREENGLLRGQVRDVVVLRRKTHMDGARYREYARRRAAQAFANKLLDNGAILFTETNAQSRGPYDADIELTATLAVIHPNKYDVHGLVLAAPDIREPREDDDDFVLEEYALHLAHKDPRRVQGDYVRFTLHDGRTSQDAFEAAMRGNEQALVQCVATVAVKCGKHGPYAYVVSR